ncbi:GntR family transcriptional regulator [Corynebacterium xerosis]|uniref:GntR family transcriptional regulator n=2 Tax=Corynebacterium xerosis TaxID=1725 RepID=A0A2N6T162_9CORY|nr:GntR family transcriptional regulator [Corynebacterium xerosis]PMC63049.1 GntR family transcriptional regulator [Corynebacterium xerosis]QGS35343.1 GntR family transcriptional regulator [Corynebacterium xerosis]
MLIQLDSTSATPLYAQLVASLRRAVSTGEVPVGDKLPSAGDLAQALDLNKNTVLRAYRQLRDEGVVELRRGRGATVVAGADGGRALPESVETALDELAAIARESSIPMSDLVAGLTIRGVR